MEKFGRMEIVFIRHGKTKGNLEGRYVGRTDEPLLTEETERLKKSSYRAFAPDVVYTSGMLRCRQTAETLFPVCGWKSGGLFPESGVPVPLVVHAGLNETDFGDFEYKNYEELKDNPAYQAWLDSGGTLAFPGGELGADFRARCREAFLECIADAKKRNAGRVAFVVHGGTIMAIMEAFAVPERGFYDWQVKNGEGFFVELEKFSEENVALKLTDDKKAGQ